MRFLLLAPLSLAAIFFVTSGAVSRRPNPPQASTQDVKVIEVSAKKYEFNPSSIHVKQGTKVQLRITATDHTHGFKIGAFSDGSNTNGSPGLVFTSPEDCWKIEKGQSSTIEFVAQKRRHVLFQVLRQVRIGSQWNERPTHRRSVIDAQVNLIHFRTVSSGELPRGQTSFVST